MLVRNAVSLLGPATASVLPHLICRGALLRPSQPVHVRIPVSQPGLLRAKRLRILLVGVRVVDIGVANPVRILERVDHRPGRIRPLGGPEHGLSDVVQHGDAVVQHLTCFIQRALPHDGRMIYVPPDRLDPLRQSDAPGF